MIKKSHLLIVCLLFSFFKISALDSSALKTTYNKSSFNKKHKKVYSQELETLVNKLKVSLSSIYKEKKLKFQDFNLSKTEEGILLKGGVKFYGVELALDGLFTKDQILKSISGKLKPGSNLNSRKFGLLNKGGKGLKEWFPDSLEDKISLSGFTINFEGKSPSEIVIDLGGINNWKIIGDGGLSFNNISGKVITENPLGAKKFKASLEGDFSFGGASVKSTAFVGSTKEAWVFKGELANISLTNAINFVATSVAKTSLPTNIVDIGISKSSFSVAPAAKTFSLNGSALISGNELGELQMKVKPMDKSKLGFLIGISPAADFKMAKLNADLKILDDLKIANFGMVLSSQATSDSGLDVFKRIGGSTSIGRGFNFIGSYDLRPTGLNDLIGLEAVMVKAVVSNNVSDLLLEGALNVNIPLGKAATFKKALFRIKPLLEDFKISIGGELEVKVDTDVLLFKTEMGVDVSDQAIFITALMDGTWNEPFDVKELSIGNLGVTLGLSFRTTPIPLPEIGIKGELRVKDFKGDLLVFLNANNPTESAIDVGFNKIGLKAILEEFCDKQTLQKIPADIRNTVLDISLEDVRLTVAARPVTVMERSFDPGFRVKGTAAIGDIVGLNLDVQVGYDGIDATAGMKKISHPPFFELKGARGREDPIIQIVAKASTESKVLISGSATLLGITSETDLLINDKGFDLYMNGKIFNAFQAELEVTGNRVKDGGSFRVAATMKQDFMKYLTENASQEIDKATKKTQQDITSAQNKISAAQTKLNSLNKNIADMRNTVKAERKRDLDNIRKAKQAVVNSKRQHFNDIVNNINSINRKVNAAHAGIARKKKEIANANVLEKAGLSLKYAPYFTEQAFIISTQETAKGVQLGYKEAANVALKAAEESVGLVHTLGSKTPIDADPRIVALIGGKETANVSMEIGKGILEGAKIVGVGTLGAAKWIVENGPTSVVNITYAHFEAKLSGAHGGSILVHMKGTFAGKPMDERFTVNFENPLDSAKKFANSLL